MLDINIFRVQKGGDPTLLIKSQIARGLPESTVQTVIDLDTKWTAQAFNVDELRKKANALQKTIQQGKKEKKGMEAEIEERQNVMAEIKEGEAQKARMEKERDEAMKMVGNIVHESVHVSMDEDENPIIRDWSPSSDAFKRPEKLLTHDQVLDRIAGYDPERGQKIAGHRGFFLMNAAVDLNQALISYGLEFLRKRQFTKIMTPFFMKKEMMAKTAQLSQFDEELYKLVEEARHTEKKNPTLEDALQKTEISAVTAKAEPQEDKYLIATSEQPISCLHSGEWFDQPSKQLPKRYAGYSTCFRREAGSGGRDTWGIFRIHQFEKVEQFCLTEPEKSWEMFDEMIANSEDFYKSLGLPYRVISIVSGALNLAAAKKYDLEAYFPAQNKFKELVSCSNCTDYQARTLEIRCGLKKMNQAEKKYVHLLNSTLTATERTLCCIMENYQEENGLRIPEVLQPYMHGQTFLDYIAPAKVHK